MPGQTDRSPRVEPAAGLRILFVVERGAVLRFALLIPALAERGHEVHIAFVPNNNWRTGERTDAGELPRRTVDMVGALCARFPTVSYGHAPRRADRDGWRQVAWLVRGLADLAHSAHPRYAAAGVLRRRTTKRILPTMQMRGEFEPLGRRWALKKGRALSKRTDAELSRLVLRTMARLEEAIPSSRKIDRYIRGHAPDIVLATGTFRHVSTEVEYLKSARSLGIPSGTFVTSWDNLTNKGSLKFTPERVFVWNEVQAREAADLHRIPRDRIRITGAHVFDEWFARRPSRSREEFLGQLGLDPSEPYVLYLCSSRNVARPSEVEFVRRWIEALRSSGDERVRRIAVVVRPHPNADLQWRGVEIGLENAIVWPKQGVHPIAEHARDDFFDSIAYSSAVIGINTTAMIEAAILGKSVLTVLVEDFAQETTLHFHYLLAKNGGFLHVAANLHEHVAQLADVLEGDDAGAERRRAFVESFVRPHGLDHPAAGLGADAIEELVGLRVSSKIGPRARMLRAALSLEAGLNSVYSSFHALRAGARRPDALESEPGEVPR